MTERRSVPEVVVTAPQVEHLREPLGIGTATPRLTWQTTGPPGWVQRGYEVRCTRADGSVEVVAVESADQVLVPWGARPLGAREAVAVAVRVHGADGSSSGWGPATDVEAGLLRPEDWAAQPVGPSWPEDTTGERRGALVRRSFVLPSPVRRARLYVSAHGVYEAEVNGRRVGDETLAPGWTVYGQRLRYATHDVTDLLQEGPNVLGAWLGDGWYRGRLGFGGGTRDVYGSDVGLIAQLEVTHADGTVTTVASDGSWQCAPSPVLFAGLYDGERFDARQHDPAWSTTAGATGDWRPVRVGQRDPATLVAPEGPPVRAVTVLEPRAVLRTPSGRTVLDFGQNLVGRLRIRVSGPAGRTITLRHAEVLQDGEICTRPLRTAAALDQYTLAGTGVEEWEPRFTLHGFRYAEVTGWPGELTTADVRAVVHHTDMTRTGWFETSDPLLDQLHENVVWSTRGNFVDVPTDCPQRDERLGWTCDLQVFAPTASFLFDCTGMLSSWLKDLEAEQLPDGTVPWYVPVVPGGEAWTPPRPGAAWGDAAVLTPAVLHARAGDLEVLRTQYGSARRWVDLVDRLAGPGHLWDTSHQLGDWLDPTAPPEDPAAGATDRHLVATAYFAWSAQNLAETALATGHHADAEHYERLAAAVRRAFRDAYGTADGLLRQESATGYALALVFGLVEEPAERAAAGDRLAALVRAGGNRITTGFVGTPVLCDALTGTGHLDVAYDLLLQRECPSWLYPVLSGATTVWERWDSLLPDGTVNPGEMTSFNHYALGAVADWMHRVVGGLTPTAPGYRTVLVAPRPGGGLTRCRTRHTAPYGDITVEWRLEDQRLLVEVELPVGVTALVQLPGEPPVTVGPGRHGFGSG